MRGTLPPPPEAAPPRRLPRPTLSAAGWLVCLGLAVRLVHYAWNHTIWYDEPQLLQVSTSAR